MASWATEFAQEVLNSEAKTKDTWSDLSQQLRTAVAEINKILEGKSQTKLAFAETGDLISVSSTLNRKVSLNLDSHARTVSVLVGWIVPLTTSTSHQIRRSSLAPAVHSCRA
jgi:hypothetical protein